MCPFSNNMRFTMENAGEMACWRNNPTPGYETRETLLRVCQWKKWSSRMTSVIAQEQRVASLSPFISVQFSSLTTHICAAFSMTEVYRRPSPCRLRKPVTVHKQQMQSKLCYYKCCNWRCSKPLFARHVMSSQVNFSHTAIQASLMCLQYTAVQFQS